MAFKISKGLVKRIETSIVVFLLLYADILNISPTLRGNLNSVSYLLVAFLIIRNWKRVVFIISKDVILGLLVATAVCSVLWSSAPEFTIDEGKALLRSSFLGAYLATSYTSKGQMELLMWTIGLSAVLSLVVTIGIPSYGLSHTNSELTWRGIYGHKQYLGRVMAVGAITYILKLLGSQRLKWLIVAGLCLIVSLILLSRSTTGLLVFITGLLLMSLLKIVKQNYKSRMILMTSLLLLLFILAVLILSNLEFIFIDILGKDLEFNGRMPIWSLAIEKGMEHPWLGYGYAGFWTSADSSSIVNATWQRSGIDGVRTHAHNGFIDLFLQLGVVGLSLFLAGCLSLLIRLTFLMNVNKSIETFWMFEMVSLMLFFNTTEVITILAANNILWIFYVSISLSTAVQLQQNKNI